MSIYLYQSYFNKTFLRQTLFKLLIPKQIELHTFFTKTAGPKFQIAQINVIYLYVYIIIYRGNHLCFRFSGTKIFHHECRFWWVGQPTLPGSMVSSSTDAAEVVDEALIMPLRRLRSIFACHEERRRFSLKFDKTSLRRLLLLVLLMLLFFCYLRSSSGGALSSTRSDLTSKSHTLTHIATYTIDGPRYLILLEAL